MLKIRYYSDIHLEFGNFRIPDTCKDTVLVLAGDIGVGGEAFNLIQKNASKFLAILYVLGNHEHYGQNLIDNIAKWKERAETIENFYVLENDTVKIQDVVFIGATLWTDFNKSNPHSMLMARSTINDYNCIRLKDVPGYETSRRKALAEYITPLYMLAVHNCSRKYIEDKLEEHINDKVCVITHHAPHPIASGHRNDKWGLWLSDLEELMWDDELSPNVWIFGHTHTPINQTVGHTLLLSNPRGYVGHETIQSLGEEVCL